MDENKTRTLKNPEHHALVEPYLSHETVQSMENFIQHGGVTTLDHVIRVTELALWLADKLPLDFDMPTIAAAGMLHDFYLYDWHGTGFQHAVNHPVTAARNAEKTFGVGPEVTSAIESHMWPLPPTRPPKSREAALINLSDKLAAAYETLFLRKKREHNL